MVADSDETRWGWGRSRWGERRGECEKTKKPSSAASPNPLAVALPAEMTAVPLAPMGRLAGGDPGFGVITGFYGSGRALRARGGVGPWDSDRAAGIAPRGFACRRCGIPRGDAHCRLANRGLKYIFCEMNRGFNLILKNICLLM